MAYVGKSWICARGNEVYTEAGFKIQGPQELTSHGTKLEPRSQRLACTLDYGWHFNVHVSLVPGNGGVAYYVLLMVVNSSHPLLNDLGGEVMQIM